jgi:uncharacterized protein (DUF1697 family)
VTTYIALLRGINVVGKKILPMKALVAILGDLGCQDVRTYIQSGNAVFRCRELDPAQFSKQLTAAIATSFGFKPAVQLLRLQEVAKIAASNPFPQAEAAHKTLHIYFLESEPKSPALDGLEEIRAPNERFVLQGKAFYLHAPDGIGRSKLAANVEKLLGVSATSRNWRTVCKVIELAKELDSRTSK